MKVGIITFHFVSNQGGVLQTYASQTFFEKNGYDVNIIDYQPKYHTVRYDSYKNPFIYSRQFWRKFKEKKLPKRILLTIRSFFRCIYLNLTHADFGVNAEFNKFISENLHLTRCYESLRQLERDPPVFDAYITGSDQLWNPDITDYRYDDAYFLLFTDRKVPKVAYAVSTGKVLSSREEGELAEKCKQLTAVSMREQIDSTMKAVGKDVHICIDPTLLLDADDYSSVESEQTESEPYIFVYGFETNGDIKNALKLAVKKYGCSVINGSPNRVKLDGDSKNLSDYGPDRFLTLIKNAQCVVTNSFHGTVFSIIYKKDFITVSHTTRGRRMNELLGKLNLCQRLWGSEEFVFEKNVDWEQVYKKLNVLRKHSGEYLLSGVNGVSGEKIPHWDEEKTVKMKDKYEELKVYAGSLTDKQKLKASASGGAATAFAEQIIGNGGVVVGAAYKEDFKSVEFIFAETKEELNRLRGSKYIPAEKNIGGVLIYEMITKKLESGKQVLFIGLPCDVGALKLWLKRNEVCADKLITVDLICHGPTMQKVQQNYIENLEAKFKSRVKSFSTRYVKNKWSLPYIRAEFNNGKIYTKPLYETDFGFALKYYARPSCYQCHFKGINHMADITIGDYWGLTPDAKEYDKNGVSVMFARSSKGEKLIHSLQDSYFKLFEADTSFVVKHNPMFEESTKKVAFYDRFEKDFKEGGLHFAVRNSPGRRLYSKAALKNRLLLITGKK